MNFGRDIAEGLSKSFQQVGAQAPQQMQNERMQMQQAALNIMHQRQQEAQFKAEQLLQQKNQLRQQANIDRAFKAQEEQREISNKLANDRFQFEQRKFAGQNLTPEQIATLKNEEMREKIKKIYNKSKIGNLEIYNEEGEKPVTFEEFHPIGNSFVKQLANEIGEYKSHPRSNLMSYITNKFPDRLLKIDSKADIVNPDNIEIAIGSDTFNNFAEKELKKNKEYEKIENTVDRKKFEEKFKKNIKDKIRNHLETVYTQAGSLAEAMSKEFGVAKDEKSQLKLFNNAVLALTNDNPEKGIQNLIRNTISAEVRPEEFNKIIKEFENEENNDIEGQIFDVIGEKRYPEDTNNQMQNPEEQIKQRNQNINKSVDDHIDQTINNNPSEALGLSIDDIEKMAELSGSPIPAIKKRIEGLIHSVKEPIRKIAHNFANILGTDPDWLRKPETLQALESKHPYQAMLAALPTQAFLMFQGEGAAAAGANLIKKGIAENFIVQTALNAAVNGGISKASGENFTEGAIGSVEGDLLGLGLGKGLDIGMAARTGFKEGGIKDAVKAGFNELKPNIFKNQKAADIAEQQGKKILEETTKSLNKDLETEANKIGEAKIKPIIEDNINLKENLDAKTVKGFQEKGEEYYKKAAENYKKSKEFDRDFKQEEISKFYEDVGEISKKLIEKNPGDKSILSDIQNVENMIQSIESTKDAKNVIKNLNRDYSKSEKGFYQEIAKEYKPVIEKLITEADKGYYKLGNKYFTNLKQFGKQLKADNIVNDSFKLAEDLSELGSKDLQAIKSLNDLHSDPLSKLLKKPNLQNFDLTTAKGIEATLEKSLKELYPHLENPEKLKKSFENFEKDSGDLKYQLKKHPEIEKKFENVYSKIKEHINTLDEIEAAKQLNNKTIKEFSTAATEDIIKNPKKVVNKITGGDKSEIVKLVKDWIPKNWENVFESLTSPIETISKFFAKNDVAKKLNEILNHHTKNEKFAKQLIAEDLAKDLENLIKNYKEKAIKSKAESTDKLKNLIGKISKTTFLNLKRGDE
ncbi:MAG: hypothetical protein RI930_195 [Pseudomonadota bacterium]